MDLSVSERFEEARRQYIEELYFKMWYDMAKAIAEREALQFLSDRLKRKEIYPRPENLKFLGVRGIEGNVFMWKFYAGVYSVYLDTVPSVMRDCAAVTVRAVDIPFWKINPAYHPSIVPGQRSKTEVWIF